MDEVRQLLNSLGLVQYTDAFRENAIDRGLLAELTDDDLRTIGVSALGHRKRILRAILEMEDGLAGASSASLERRDPTGDAERRQLTVMFCDLVGSTELAQRLDPEELRDINRAYQDAVTAAIERFGGYVARYMGDGVLAYFGYPEAHEDDAERAVRSALSVVADIPRLEGRESLATRVGIATGPVVVGDLIGASASQERAVVGEAPNLAARIQGEAIPNSVIACDATHKLVGGLFTVNELEPRLLRGFSQKQQLWHMLGERLAESRFDALHGRELAPFVGRRSELGLLLERWDEAREGEGQIVLISGEAGIGKSRLLHALTEHLDGESCTRLRFQCAAHQVNSALQPITQYLTTSADIAPGDGAATRLEKLEQLIGLHGQCSGQGIALIAELLAIPGGGRHSPLKIEPQERRKRTLAVLVDHFISLTASKPVLFLFEDAHWIDPTTFDVLESTARRSASAPILMVITHRSEWSGTKLAILPNSTALSLNRLPRKDVARIALAVGGATLPKELVEQIVQQTDGVPLFVEELTKSIVERGPEAGYKALPASLQASLLARLDRLGAEARDIAQMGAVIGREFPYRLLAKLVEDESVLARALGLLVSSGLIFQAGAAPDATYTFKHALVQDTAYDSLLRTRRSELHGAIVAVLESGSDTGSERNVELLAHHAQHAGLHEQAVRYGQMAAQKANRRSSFREAQRFLDGALAHLDQMPDGARRDEQISIRLAMRPSLGALGDYERLLTVLSDVEALASKLGANESAVIAGIHKTHVLCHIGRVEDALHSGKHATRAARALGEVRLTISARAILAMTYFFRGDLRKAIATALPDAPALRDDLRHDRLETTGTSSVNWLSNLAGMHAVEGDFAAAEEFSADAHAIAEEMATPFDVGMAGHWSGMVALAAGRTADARARLEPVIQLCEEHDLDFLVPWGCRHLGAALTLSGESRRAQEILRRGVEAARHHDLELAVIWNTAELADADSHAADLDAALAHANEARLAAVAAGSVWLESVSLRYLARATALSGDARSAEALKLFQRALVLASQCEARPDIAHCRRELGAFFGALGRHEKAREELGAALSGYRELGTKPWEMETERALAKLD